MFRMKLFVTAQESAYEQNEDGSPEVKYQPYVYEPTTYLSTGEILLGEVEVDIFLPTPNRLAFVNKKIADFRREQGKLYEQNMRLEEQIQSLLALPNLSGEAS